jgi:hypothetical protein
MKSRWAQIAAMPYNPRVIALVVAAVVVTYAIYVIVY